MFIGPISNTAVSSGFHFRMIVGGIFTDDRGLVVPLSTPAAVLSYEGVSVINPPSSMTTGQSATATYGIKNTGNVVWHDELFEGGAHSLRLIMNRPVYRSSAFYDSGDIRWLSPGQIAKPNGTTWPGDTATFTFNWKAPGTTGPYMEAFVPAVGGRMLTDYGARFDTVVH
jgi:hypothetical protein